MSGNPLTAAQSPRARGESEPSRDGGGPAELAVGLLVPVVVVFLLFGPYISQVLRDETRKLFLWQSGYAVYFLAVILLLGLACGVIGTLVRRSGLLLPRRICEHFFVIAFGGAVLANLCHHMKGMQGYHFAARDWETQTLWMLIFGAVGYSLFRKDSALVQRCRQACLIVAPIVLVLSLQLGRLGSDGSAIEPFPETTAAPQHLAAADPTSTPVYLFVFDEWSYHRTYPGGVLDPRLSNLAALSQTAAVFHDAHAPGEATLLSMPGLLFQTALPVFHEQQEPGQRTVFSKTIDLRFERNGKQISCDRFRDLFCSLNRRGYRSIVLGFNCPYRAWLGDDVDVYRSYPWLTYYMGDRLSTHAAVHLYNAMEHWTDPWSAFARHKLERRVGDHQALMVFERMKADVLEVLERQPLKTAAVIHYPLPHDPYIWNERGEYVGPEQGTWDFWVPPETYGTNLQVLDGFIGECVTALKRRGIYDRALLILTSDHSWRYDPDPRAGDFTHVPLIVKLPGQRHPQHIQQPFQNHLLGALIDRVIENPRSTGDLATLLTSLEAPGYQAVSSR